MVNEGRKLEVFGINKRGKVDTHYYYCYDERDNDQKEEKKYINDHCCELDRHELPVSLHQPESPSECVSIPHYQSLSINIFS